MHILKIEKLELKSKLKRRSYRAANLVRRHVVRFLWIICRQVVWNSWKIPNVVLALCQELDSRQDSIPDRAVSPQRQWCSPALGTALGPHGRSSSPSLTLRQTTRLDNFWFLFFFLISFLLSQHFSVFERNEECQKC